MKRIVYILLNILLLLALTMPGYAVKEGTFDYRLELTDSSGKTIQVQLTSSVPQSAFAKSWQPKIAPINRISFCSNSHLKSPLFLQFSKKTPDIFCAA